MAPIRLFCFPYAGAAAWIFRGLAQRLAGRFDVVAVDLPGRGRRHAEPLVDDWSVLVRLLASDVKRQIDRPYALLGYSLGAVVALEVMAELFRQHSPRSPLALIACAAPGPAAMNRSDLHLRDDRRMFEGLRHLGGIPDEMMDSPELLALMAPVVRADLRLFESYRRPDRAPFPVPIVACHGIDDASVGDRYQAWQGETSASFRTRGFVGGHMFLHGAEAELARAVTADLEACGTLPETT